MKKVLLLGSGELGKEFVIAAKRAGAYVVACDRYDNAPAMQVADEREIFSMLDGDALTAVVKSIKQILSFLRLKQSVQNVFLILKNKAFKLYLLLVP